MQGAIANTRAVLLDRTGHLTPLGSAGHLHVGGLGLARDFTLDPYFVQAARPATTAAGASTNPMRQP